MLAFPPAVIVQDGEDRIAAEEAPSWHVVSVVNPEPVPETTWPIEPDEGVSVNVPAVPTVTAKFALAESSAPAFV